MIDEHRTHTVAHGLMDEYLVRCETHALPLPQKHLGRLVGFFVTDMGPLNQVLHVWACDKWAQREQCHAAMESDPAWDAFKHINRGSFVQQDVKVLRPTRFSPLP